jgi:WD40 repeat protein
MQHLLEGALRRLHLLLADLLEGSLLQTMLILTILVDRARTLLRLNRQRPATRPLPHGTRPSAPTGALATCLAFAPLSPRQEVRLASAWSDGTVAVYWLDRPPVVSTYQGHSAWVCAVAWSPDGSRLASAGADGTVQIWDAATGVKLYTYREHGSEVRCISWSPDGKQIASGGMEGTLRIWEIATGATLATGVGHTSAITSLAWWGALVLSGSKDYTARLWNAATGECLATCSHQGPVTSVAWAQDGSRFATGSADSTVRVWSMLEGTPPPCIFTYHGHTGSLGVVGIVWSADNKRVISADEHDLHEWTIPSATQVAVVISMPLPLPPVFPHAHIHSLAALGIPRSPHHSLGTMLGVAHDCGILIKASPAELPTFFGDDGVGGRNQPFGNG